MNYKSCKKINETFILDSQMQPHLAVRDIATDEISKTVPVTNPMEKGYIYASLFFFDEVTKEIEKLNTMIQRVWDELNQEVVIDNPTLLLMELSNRVKSAIGDDSLDALIKEMLSEKTRAMALMPDDAEKQKLMVIKEAIYTELFHNFIKITFKNATEYGEYKKFTFTKDYVDQLTERQKKLLAPALRVAGLIQQIRLDEFELQPDWTVRYKPGRISEDYATKEEEIKNSLKKLMEQHLHI